MVRPVGAQGGEPRLPDLGGLPWASEHRQRVGERDVGLLQCERVVDSPGELDGLIELGEALVGATEIGEVAADRDERPDLDVGRADQARELERLLAHRT